MDLHAPVRKQRSEVIQTRLAVIGDEDGNVLQRRRSHLSGGHHLDDGREVEIATDTGRAFNPHPATHGGGETRGYGETEACASIPARHRTIALLECLENHLLFIRRDSETGV